MTSIFDNKEIIDKDILNIKPIHHKGYWVFEHNKKYYNIAPSHATALLLSPTILGIDKIMLAACHFKNINIEKGFCLKVSEKYFENCDVQLNYNDTLFDGWVYDVQPECFKDVKEHQKIWMCPYLKFYYNSPPKTLYVKVEDQ